MRAWTGRNAEVTAELLVTDVVEKGLKALLDSARLVEVPDSFVLPQRYRCKLPSRRFTDRNSLVSGSRV